VQGFGCDGRQVAYRASYDGWGHSHREGAGSHGGGGGGGGGAPDGEDWRDGDSREARVCTFGKNFLRTEGKGPSLGRAPGPRQGLPINLGVSGAMRS